MGALGLAHATAIYKPNLLIKFTADSTFPIFSASYFDKGSALLQLAILVVTTDADRARRGATYAPSRCNSARPIPPMQPFSLSVQWAASETTLPNSFPGLISGLVPRWASALAGARGCGLGNAFFTWGSCPDPEK
jgi:hypothetical protein